MAEHQWFSDSEDEPTSDSEDEPTTLCSSTTTLSTRRAANASSKKRAREGLSSSTKKKHRAKDASSKSATRAARTSHVAVNLEAAFANDIASPSTVTPATLSTRRAANASSKKRAREGLSSSTKKKHRAKDASSKSATRAARTSHVAVNLEAAFVNECTHPVKFSPEELQHLEAELDHDPIAAITWLAASSQASFGYRDCPMEEQLEAVLGIDGDQVLPPGIQARIVEEMKKAMDCRQINACAACGFRGYQSGSNKHVSDLQWLEMEAETLKQFEAKSELVKLVSSSTLLLGKRYHLHQELVSDDGNTWICDICDRGAKSTINPLSLKAGVDYGSIRRLPWLSTLTIVEQALVANNRFYSTTFHCSLAKNSGLKMKGHTISLQQDSLKQMATTFAGRIQSVVEDVTVIFQGPRSLLQQSHAAGAMSVLLGANQKNIMDHYAVFSELIPSFYSPEFINEIDQMNSNPHSIRAHLDAMRTTLLTQAICVDDETALRHTAHIAALMTDNVATTSDHMEDSESFPHVCILPRHAPSGRGEVEIAAESAVCSAVNIPPPPVVITAGAAVNEFDANQAWCVGSFPWVFPLGAEAAKLPAGPLNAKVRRHILNQFHCTAAQDIRLVFGFGNQAHRHDVLRSVSKQRVSSGKLQEFTDTLASVEFMEDVSKAQEGDSEATRAVVEKLTPMIDFSLHAVTTGPSERANCVKRIHALNYQYGPPALFLTVSPDAVHDPASVMMSFPTPGQFDHDEFLREFASSGSFNVDKNCTPINLGTANLKRLFAANPVASVESFNKKIAVILEIFFGFVPGGKRSKAPGYGMLGRSFAYYLVVEAQGRGCLHFHMLFWGTFSPQLIQAASCSPTYKEIVSKALEKMVSCELPRQTHLDQLELRARLAQRIEGSSYPTAVMRSPDAVSGASYETRAYAAALESNIHRHTFTCRKGKTGKCQCRMCMPAGRLDHTGFKLVEHQNEPPHYKVCQFIPDIDIACTSGRDLQTHPMPFTDHRLISFGVKRRLLDGLTREEMERLLASLPQNSVNWMNSVLPLQNGLVSAFNTELMAVFACNQNFALTGSSVDAKNVTYYVAKYMSKDAHSLAATAAAFFLAKQHVEAHPSCAADKETSVRKAQHLLTNTINRIEGAIELSQDQAANLALGFQADQCNCKFWYCYIGAAVNFVQQQSAAGAESREYYADEDLADDDNVENEYVEQCLEKDDRPGFNGVGSTEIFAGALGNVAVPTHLHYAHRGTALHCMTFSEYCSCIHITPISVADAAANLEKANTQASHAAAHRLVEEPVPKQVGRKANQVFLFDELHPLSKSHKQQLRSLQRVPIPVPPPPRMPEGLFLKGQSKNADAAAAYFMVLFSPWHWNSLPLLSHADWANYCRQLQREQSVLSLHRLAVMTNMSHGLGVLSGNEKASICYRNRNVCKWNAPASALDGTALPPGLGRDDRIEEDAHSEDAQVADDAIAEILNLAEGALSAVQLENRLKKMAKEDARIELLMRQVVRAFPPVHAANRDNLELPKVFETCRTKVDAELATDWLLKEHHNEHHESGARAANTVPAWPTTDNLTSKQLELVKMVEPLLVLNREDPSFHQASCLLVHGGPGTGKSYFVQHLAKSVAAVGCEMRCGAFAACAAGILPHSNTIHSLLCIPFSFQTSVYKPLKEKELINQRREWQNVRVLVLDEISMIPEALLGWASMRLRQIMDVPLPFGGLVTILMGDFFQISCIPPPTLAQSVLLVAALERTVIAGSVNEEAVGIMHNLTMFAFIEQKRSKDAEWTALLQQIRDTGSMNSIMHHFRHLDDNSADEVGDWAFPTIATTGNSFRQRLNQHQLSRFSRAHGMPLYKWPVKIQKSTPSIAKIEHDLLLKTDPRFFGAFCFGAPVTLTENMGRFATKKGVSNGTKCTMHAIWSKTFTNEPYVNPENPSADDVWIDRPKWLVLATLDVYDQAMFPGNPIPAEALTSDGRLLICMKNSKLNKPIKIEVLGQDVRLRK
jgi:hypothetical protein